PGRGRMVGVGGPCRGPHRSERGPEARPGSAGPGRMLGVWGPCRGPHVQVMPHSVGFIGLGTMGGPMAANLAKAGVPLVVHDASPAAVTATTRHAGVTAAGSPGDVAAQVAVLFTALPNDDIVRS